VGIGRGLLFFFIEPECGFRRIVSGLALISHIATSFRKKAPRGKQNAQKEEYGGHNFYYFHKRVRFEVNTQLFTFNFWKPTRENFQAAKSLFKEMRKEVSPSEGNVGMNISCSKTYRLIVWNGLLAHFLSPLLY